MKLRWAYILAALLIALGVSLTAACGGGDGDGEGADRPAAVEDEADDGEAEEEQEDGELAEPAAAFADLRSYRYRMQFTIEATPSDEGAADDIATDDGPFGGLFGIGEGGAIAFGFDIEGAFMAPDSEQVKVSGSLFGLELEEESITIGSRTWVRTNGSWEESEVQLGSEDFSPAGFFDAFDAADLRALKPSKETVNGVASLRYTITSADLAALARFSAIFGDGADLEDLPENFDFNIDLWLAEDGQWPVRMVMLASGSDEEGEFNFEVSMDIMDVNDESIEIEPPI